jgi:hypothetical protein
MRFKLGWKADSNGYNFIFQDNFLIRTYKGSKLKSDGQVNPKNQRFLTYENNGCIMFSRPI